MQTFQSLMPQNAILGEVSLRPANDKAALKAQTDNFEAIVIKQMLDISMPEENALFGKSAGSQIYRSMYHEEMGRTLAGGFGYSELLFKFLEDRL
ncbi:MAG: rod-binding protein [Campylobacterales bacterium]